MITVDNNRTTVPPGMEIATTIVASNPGPSDVLDATVGDIFPAELLSVSWTCEGADGGSCTASGMGDITDTVDLPAGASVMYTAVGLVDPAATGTLVNTATITEPDTVTERNPADNTATDTDPLTEPIFADGFFSGDTSAWG